MLIIFESILPIFLLVILGVVLKRTRLINESFWSGLEQFGYFVLFPALLFQTLSSADFSALDSGSVGFVSLLAVGVMTGLVLALWPLLKRSGMGGPAYTSVFQTSTRWNGFMALAIAEKLTGATGLTVIAVIMAYALDPLVTFLARRRIPRACKPATRRCACSSKPWPGAASRPRITWCWPPPARSRC